MYYLGQVKVFLFVLQRVTIVDTHYFLIHKNLGWGSLLASEEHSLNLLRKILKIGFLEAP